MPHNPFKESFIIESITENNQKFHPSDWAERLSSTLANFDSDNKLKYSGYAHPCIIEGQKCLVVARGLKEFNPDVYNFILDFAQSNKLRIQDDRRTNETQIKNDRRQHQQNLQTPTPIT